MKKISLAAAFAAASLLSSGAMAQAYVNAAVGASHYEADCSGTTSCDNSDVGARIALGYQFLPNISGEVGYMSFGRAKATVGAVGAKLEASGLFIGAAFRGDFSPRWNGTARLGVVSMKTKVSDLNSSASADETNAAAYVGLALGYQLTTQMAVELGADFSRAEIEGSKADVRNLSVGVRYAF